MEYVGLGEGGGRRLDGLSGIWGGGCDLVTVRVGEGLEKGLWKIRETVQGVSKEGEVVLVGRGPVVKACEVGRKVD